MTQLKPGVDLRESKISAELASRKCWISVDSWDSEHSRKKPVFAVLGGGKKVLVYKSDASILKKLINVQHLL